MTPARLTTCKGTWEAQSPDARRRTRPDMPRVVRDSADERAMRRMPTDATYSEPLTSSIEAASSERMQASIPS